MTDAAPPIATDALVIGAGPVGLFQAFQLGLLEIGCHLVDALPHVGGQCVQLYGDKPIYDIPGVPATTGRGLVEALERQVAPFSPPVHLGEQIETLARQPDGRLLLGTAAGLRFMARTVFIAAGVGAFVPRRVPLEGLARFEGDRLFYHPDALERFDGRSVVVQGGDEAALATALALVGRASAVVLVHRRDAFQAPDALVAELRSRIANGGIRLVVGQPSAFDGSTLELATPEGSTVAVALDAWIACLGISPRLGPLADWGLAMDRKQLKVDPARFETGERGVFAVGDVNTYPGKKKLIVCGFHEATLAAWAAAELVFPGRALPLQYTTTSPRLHALLGVTPRA